MYRVSQKRGLKKSKYKNLILGILMWLEEFDFGVPIFFTPYYKINGVVVEGSDGGS